MKRSTRLVSRKPWRPHRVPAKPATQCEYVARPRETATAAQELPPAAPQPKNPSLVCEAYRNAVRAMACYRCGWPPRSEFCHSDEGKGIGYKTDDRTGWPGCGPHQAPGQDHMHPGCHWFVGTSGRMAKAERRAFEARASAATRAAVLAMGKWPAALPMFNDEREAEAA